MTEQEMTDALAKHHKALFAVIDEIFATPQIKATPPPKETWLIRQLKTMRVDAQLSGLDHEANVLTAAVEELGGTV